MKAGGGSGLGAGSGSGLGAGGGSGLGASVGLGLGAGVGSELGAGVGSGLGAGVGSGLGAGIGSGLGAGVGSGLGAGVRSGLGAGVGSGLGASSRSGNGERSIGGGGGVAGGGLRVLKILKAFRNSCLYCILDSNSVVVHLQQATVEAGDYPAQLFLEKVPPPLGPSEFRNCPPDALRMKELQEAYCKDCPWLDRFRWKERPGCENVRTICATSTIT